MFADDRSYYQQRAEAEVARARSATKPEAALIHHQLAEAYRGKLSSAEPRRIEAL